MQPIKINMATVEYFDKRYVHSALIGFAAFILIISSHNIYSFFNNKKEINNYTEKISRLESSLIGEKRILNEKMEKTGENKITSASKKTLFVNRLIARDIFPWNQLLYMLEIRLPDEMLLTNFSPSENFKHLTLKGSADSTGAISLFLTRLNDWDLLQNNILTSLSLIKNNSKEDNGKIQFTIESTFRVDRFFTSNGYGDLGKILGE